MKYQISMSSAEINEADIQAVVDVMRSGRLALGPQTREFERLVAEYVGVEHAVAVNSGTSALHLLVRALGLGPGDEVLVPSFTFAASVNAMLFERATPVFVDVEPGTYNLDPVDVARKITPATKAVMAVDIFGHPVAWDALLEIAAEHDLQVIDDSCEALGADYKGRKVGQFGDTAAFAFYPNKQMTVGEGGIIVTDDDEIAYLARSMRNQGRGEMGAWLEHERLGYNYRLDEISAALGVSQFKRLETFLEKRARRTNVHRALAWPGRRASAGRQAPRADELVRLRRDVGGGLAARRRHPETGRPRHSQPWLLRAAPHPALHPRDVRRSARHAARDGVYRRADHRAALP